MSETITEQLKEFAKQYNRPEERMKEFCEKYKGYSAAEKRDILDRMIADDAAPTWR